MEVLAFSVHVTPVYISCSASHARVKGVHVTPVYISCSASHARVKVKIGHSMVM